MTQNPWAGNRRRGHVERDEAVGHEEHGAADRGQPVDSGGEHGHGAQAGTVREDRHEQRVGAGGARAEERRDDPRATRAMEMRGDILAALADLAHTVRDYEVTGPAGDDWN